MKFLAKNRMIIILLKLMYLEKHEFDCDKKNALIDKVKLIVVKKISQLNCSKKMNQIICKNLIGLKSR